MLKVFKKAVGIISRSELVCCHPISSSNLNADQGLEWNVIVRKNDKKDIKSFGEGVKELTFSYARKMAQSVNVESSAAPSSESSATLALASPSASISSKEPSSPFSASVKAAEKDEILKYFKLLKDDSWHPFNERVNQSFIYKHLQFTDSYDDDDDDSGDESSESRVQTLPENVTVDEDSNVSGLVKEASIHIHLQQLWHSKRVDILSKLCTLFDSTDALSLLTATRLVEDLANYEEFPFAQLVAVDIDSRTGSVRGLVIQKLEGTLANCIEGVSANQTRWGMDFGDGPSSSKGLEQKQNMFDLADRILDVVGMMHDCGVAHLDLKPHNACIGAVIIQPRNSTIPNFSMNATIEKMLQESNPLQPMIIPAIPWYLKLIDFGSSIIFNQTVLKQMRYGQPLFGVRDMSHILIDAHIYTTKGYTPPENVFGKTLAHTFQPVKVDLFAAGLIAGSLMNCAKTWYPDQFRKKCSNWLFTMHWLGVSDLGLNPVLNANEFPNKNLDAIVDIIVPLSGGCGTYKYAHGFAEQCDVIDNAIRKIPSEDDEDEDDETAGDRLNFRYNASKAWMWYNSDYTCQDCRDSMPDEWSDYKQMSCQGNVHILTDTICALEDNNTVSDARETRMPISELIRRASSLLYESPNHKSEDLAKSDCMCCIVKYVATKILDNGRSIKIGDVESADDESGNHEESETAAAPAPAEETIPASTSDDTVAAPVTPVIQECDEKSISKSDDGNVVAHETDSDNSDSDSEAEQVPDQSSFHPLRLFEFIAVFNVFMESNRTLIGWLLDYPADEHSTNFPSDSTLKKDILIISKGIMRIQLSKLITKAVSLSPTVDISKVWQYGIWRLVFCGDNVEKDLIPSFNLRKIDTVPSDILNGKCSGFCWRWPQSLEIMSILCTRGWKLALDMWWDYFSQSTGFIWLARKIVALSDRVRAATQIDASVRKLIPKQNVKPPSDSKPTESDKKDAAKGLVPNNSFGFFGRDHYLNFPFLATHSFIDRPSDFSRLRKRGGTLISLIQEAFGQSRKPVIVAPKKQATPTKRKQKVDSGSEEDDDDDDEDDEEDVVEKNDTDTWLLKAQSPPPLYEYEDDDEDNAIRILGLNDTVTLLHGIPTIWMAAFSMWQRFAPVVSAKVAKANRQSVAMQDILLLVSCAEMACVQEGRKLDATKHQTQTSWFGIGRLLFTMYIENNGPQHGNVQSLNDMIDTMPFKSDHSASFSVSDTSSPDFWYDDKRDRDADQIRTQGGIDADGSDSDTMLFAEEDDEEFDEDLEEDLEDAIEQSNAEGIVEAPTEEERRKPVEIKSFKSLHRVILNYIHIQILTIGSPQCPVVSYIQGAPKITTWLQRSEGVKKDGILAVVSDWHHMLMQCLSNQINVLPGDITVLSTAILLKYSEAHVSKPKVLAKTTIVERGRKALPSSSPDIPIVPLSVREWFLKLSENASLLDDLQLLIRESISQIFQLEDKLNATIDDEFVVAKNTYFESIKEQIDILQDDGLVISESMFECDLLVKDFLFIVQCVCKLEVVSERRIPSNSPLMRLVR